MLNNFPAFTVNDKAKFQSEMYKSKFLVFLVHHFDNPPYSLLCPLILEGVEKPYILRDPITLLRKKVNKIKMFC